MQIFPRPQRSTLASARSHSELEVVELLDETVKPQGYTLRITQQRADLIYSDAAGLRYAKHTLDQLRDEIGTLPIGEVHDWPDVETRGFMLDISRDRVPTRATLEFLVERLSAFRFNHLQLYMEHTFAYTNHPLVWSKASPMTAEDMAWLDKLCDKHGIELGANQNCFGHMERWLSHNRYRRRAAKPNGWMQGKFKRPPMSLAPTQQNADLALEITREVADSVKSPLINIGCDEVWELAKSPLTLEHLTRIAEPLLAEGRTVQVWSDLLDADPRGATSLSEAGVIATVWWYEAPGDTSVFTPRVTALAEAGYRTWVASGTGAWNSFGGRFNNAKANILDAVSTAIEQGSEGVLLTEWGDNGHLQPPFTSLPSLAFGAAAAWCQKRNKSLSEDQLTTAVSRQVEDATGNLARAMMTLGSICDSPELSEGNGTTAFYSWIRSEVPKSGRVPSDGVLIDARALIGESLELIGASKPKCDDAALLVAEQKHVAALISHGLSRAAGQTPEQSVKELRDTQRELWLLRSREGGLKDSLAKMTESG